MEERRGEEKEEGGEGERSGEEKGRRGEGEGEVEERIRGEEKWREKWRREGEKGRGEMEGEGGADGIQTLNPTILWRMGYICATELSYFFDFAGKILLLAITFFSFRILRI